MGALCALGLGRSRPPALACRVGAALMIHKGALGLTHRQETYLRGVCRGEERKAVAERHFVSDQAVRCVLSTVYRALKVRNGAGACYLLGKEDGRKSP
jgi:DNA-binding NarL/FixJ family response regulator